MSINRVASNHEQVIVSLEKSHASSRCEPWESLDAFRCVVPFLRYGDIYCLAQVCQLWDKFSKDPYIWQQIFNKAKIPLIEGQERNYKEDFRILYPITVTEGMTWFLGEMVGDIPRIDPRCFDLLFQPDPFGENGETIGQTFVFVVVPHLIRRTSGKEFPYHLDKEGNLIKRPDDSDLTEQELMIPFSAKNLKELCSFPLSENKKPIFHCNCNDDVFNQCNPCSKKIEIFLMRKDICCRGMSYSEQKNAVEKLGFKVTSFSVRALFDAACIHTFGSCPDTKKSKSYARTSDTVCMRGEYYYQSCIGNFVPRSGARVHHDCLMNRDLMGVVPSIPAEAPLPLPLNKGQ